MHACMHAQEPNSFHPTCFTNVHQFTYVCAREGETYIRVLSRAYYVVLLSVGGKLDKKKYARKEGGDHVADES